MLSKIKRSSKIEWIRRYTNLLYYDPKTVVLELENFDYISVDGYKFYKSDQLNSVQRIKGNPWFEGIKDTDIVIDIGANIGAVTVPLAGKAKFTYAVEPLFSDELELNLKLNNIEPGKVLILGSAVSNKLGLLGIEFSSNKKEVPTISFSELKDICIRVWGHIDFLKMDGEGCEWDINPEELEGIRELRIEFHIRRGRVKECKEKYNRYIQWMYKNGYKVVIDHPSYGPDPYDKEDYMVRASKTLN